eukprot:contig_17257_g4205
MAPPRLELEARHILDNGLVDGVEHSTRRGSIDLSLSSAAVAAARRLFNLFSSTLAASIAVASYSTGAIKGKTDIDSLDVAVLTLSIAGLAYVLLRTAQSLKLYTFVLNCSGLVPEGLALDAIGEIKASRKFRLSYCSEDDSDTGSHHGGGSGDGNGGGGGGG